MKRVVTFVAGLVALLAVSTPALAQQDRKVAIVVTAPSGIGVLVPVNDQVAIRPEFSFAKSSNDITTGSTTTKFDNWQLGVGVSALIYTGKPDAFRTYWCPRVSMTHVDSNSTGNNAFTVAGSYGAQYAVADRFSVFGELGLSYGWSKVESTSSLAPLTSSSKTHAFGTRSAVGVAFRF